MGRRKGAPRRAQKDGNKGKGAAAKNAAGGDDSAGSSSMFGFGTLGMGSMGLDPMLLAAMGSNGKNSSGLMQMMMMKQLMNGGKGGSQPVKMDPFTQHQFQQFQLEQYKNMLGASGAPTEKPSALREADDDDDDDGDDDDTALKLVKQSEEQEANDKLARAQSEIDSFMTAHIASYLKDAKYGGDCDAAFAACKRDAVSRANLDTPDKRERDLLDRMAEVTKAQAKAAADETVRALAVQQKRVDVDLVSEDVPGSEAEERDVHSRSPANSKARSVSLASLAKDLADGSTPRANVRKRTLPNLNPLGILRDKLRKVPKAAGTQCGRLTASFKKAVQGLVDLIARLIRLYHSESEVETLLEDFDIFASRRTKGVPSTLECRVVHILRSRDWCVTRSHAGCTATGTAA